MQSLEYNEVDYDWLLDTVEKFCKDKAVYNAVVDSIKIIDNKVKDKTSESIPELLSDALAVSFDNYIGQELRIPLNAADYSIIFFSQSQKLSDRRVI